MNIAVSSHCLAILSGVLVGFILGLVGGGGSILATPLMLYVVGLPPRDAIGTSALAVSVCAANNFANHVRAGNVRWREACLFAGIGSAGALIGSGIGKTYPSRPLLALFSCIMFAAAVQMLRKRPAPPPAGEQAGQDSAAVRAAKLGAMALLVGLLAGFFGIGGGFLIVPGLIYATNMKLILAIGSSLLAVSSFGIAAAINYALSSHVSWIVALDFILGGVAGGKLGTVLAVRLATRRQTLNQIFAALLVCVGAYMLYRNTV